MQVVQAVFQDVTQHMDILLHDSLAEVTPASLEPLGAPKKGHWTQLAGLAPSTAAQVGRCYRFDKRTSLCTSCTHTPHVLHT